MKAVIGTPTPWYGDNDKKFLVFEEGNGLSSEEYIDLIQRFVGKKIFCGRTVDPGDPTHGCVVIGIDGNG